MLKALSRSIAYYQDSANKQSVWPFYRSGCVYRFRKLAPYAPYRNGPIVKNIGTIRQRNLGKFDSTVPRESTHSVVVAA